jgi:hypothetical protein
MRLRHLLALAALAPPLAWAAAGHATPVLEIQLSETGYAPLTVSPSQPGFAAFNGAYGSFNVNFTLGQGTPILNALQIDLTSANTSSSGPAGTLHVAVTETGLTNPSGFSSFASSIGGTLNSTGENLAYASYFDNTDAAFGTQHLLSPANFSNLGAFAFNGGASGTTADPFSMSEIVTLSVPANGGAASFDASLDLPEPASLALLGSGLLGLGLIRRRRA